MLPRVNVMTDLCFRISQLRLIVYPSVRASGKCIDRHIETGPHKTRRKVIGVVLAEPMPQFASG